MLINLLHTKKSDLYRSSHANFKNTVASRQELALYRFAIFILQATLLLNILRDFGKNVKYELNMIFDKK